MNSPDLLMGLGSVIYALSKLDGELQKEEVKAVREILLDEPHGELAVCGFFLRDNFEYSTAEAYKTGMRRMAGEGIEINRETRKRFINILLQVARAHEGASRMEWEFIRKFWRELLSMTADRRQTQMISSVG
ncbi:TerB family tellurite resistance protein [Persicitalea sp.]|uniref:TerB family tellurite resistance protein n=1 Tax=Persicitalea sp. TaxID=3100273 RepID=UPI0035930983